MKLVGNVPRAPAAVKPFTILCEVGHCEGVINQPGHMGTLPQANLKGKKKKKTWTVPWYQSQESGNGMVKVAFMVQLNPNDQGGQTFLTRMLYAIKDLWPCVKKCQSLCREVILLTAAFSPSLICPKHTRRCPCRSAACQYTQEYMKTFYYFYYHAFWWVLKCFLPGTFSHWIELHRTGLHWILMDGLEKKNSNSSHTFSGPSRGAFSVLAPLSVMSNAVVLCDSSLSKRGQLPTAFRV